MQAMNDSLLALVAVLAAAAAIGTLLAWRGERTRRSGLEGELASLRESLDGERRAATAKAESKRAKTDELAELRQRLDKAKRRAFAAQEEKTGLDARVAALEGELGERERETKRLRDEVSRLEGRLEDATRDTTRLRDETARVTAERDQAAREKRVDPEEMKALALRADSAEEEVRRLTGQVREIERDALRYRQRERTHRRLYMVIRGELDAAKDRIRQLTGAPPGEAFSEPDDDGRDDEREA
jgi:chromosome segregation ATPase